MFACVYCSIGKQLQSKVQSVLMFGAQDQLSKAQELAADLMRSNELLASEAASARSAVTDLLDRTSRAQVATTSLDLIHFCIAVTLLFGMCSWRNMHDIRFILRTLESRWSEGIWPFYRVNFAE